jgi:hypothetical protein
VSQRGVEKEELVGVSRCIPDGKKRISSQSKKKLNLRVKERGRRSSHEDVNELFYIF